MRTLLSISILGFVGAHLQVASILSRRVENAISQVSANVVSRCVSSAEDRGTRGSHVRIKTSPMPNFSSMPQITKISRIALNAELGPKGRRGDAII